MLRNATRELERRRRMPHDLFHGPLIFHRIFLQGWHRQAFASQVAVATRYDDTNTSGFEQRSGLTEELTASSRRSSKVETSTKARRYAPLPSQGELACSLSHRDFPHHDAHRPRSLDRRRRGLGKTTYDHNEVPINTAVSQYHGELENSRNFPRTLGDHRRPRQGEQRLESWRHRSPNLWLKGLLEPNNDSHHWRRQVAMARSMRLPVVLLQMLLRKQESNLPDQQTLLDLLPTSREWDEVMGIVHRSGYKPEDLDYYLYILEGKTDNVRCQRFLERDSYKPTFILNFLIRKISTFTEVKTLISLIDHFRNSCTNATRRKRWGSQQLHPTQDVRPSDLNFTMTLLAHHCLRLEPRLILKLAEMAVQYIEFLATSPMPPEKVYESQCAVFNNSLRLFRPQPRMQAALRASPNAFFWEAQRKLLAMSAGLEQPFHVDREGFRAIRDVLASLAKNQTEMHSSLRHAATWPPYLQPGDGIDEATDPDDNWSRAVRAGMLMQEAGFAKEERDDAVDILQGVAPDGTPTIQLRTSLGKGRSLSTWEASIRATRNAQEAWERFRNPPEIGQKPSLPQYAAMFEKLVLREADPSSRALPGDKALNFPTQKEANLAEFERARLQPPSVGQLYQQMRLEGIRPSDACLRILVANAESLDTAHRYLNESTEDINVIHALMTGDSDLDVIKNIDISLFSAYIQVLTRQDRRIGRHMMRAIRITGARLESERSPWVEFIWGLILKNLSQHYGAFRISLAEQLKLFFYAIERIDGRYGVPLSTFIQLNKCIRKAARWELAQLSADLTSDDATAERNPTRLLYDRRSRDKDEMQRESSKHAQEAQSPHVLLRMGAARMKELFNAMMTQEKETQQLLGAHQVAALDRMIWRKDPARSEHVYGYMLSLAYVGEFEEMANVLKWLIDEWGQPDVVNALSELEEAPPYADFFEPLCAFRLFAEPMLEDGVVGPLKEAIGAAGLNWIWPDDEAVEAYAEMQEDESIAALARVLEWIRHREQTEQEAEALQD